MTHWGGHSNSGNGTSTDTSGSGGQTVGFRYFMGMHMALCRGPVDEICEFRVGDRTAWAASVLTNATLPVDAYDLFGGEAGEGGIKGDVTFLFGGPDQVCPDNLAALLDNIKSNTGTVSGDVIAIDNQTIEGYPGDDYVGIKTDDLGYVYATHSSGPDVKLARPWNLNAPLYDVHTAHGGAINPAMDWQIQYHLETGGTIPFTDGLGMQFDRYYNMAKVREMRLVAPGTAVFLVSIMTTSGVLVDTAAITLHLT